MKPSESPSSAEPVLWDPAHSGEDPNMAPAVVPSRPRDPNISLPLELSSSKNTSTSSPTTATTSTRSVTKSKAPAKSKSSRRKKKQPSPEQLKAQAFLKALGHSHTLQQPSDEPTHNKAASPETPFHNEASEYPTPEYLQEVQRLYDAGYLTEVEYLYEAGYLTEEEFLELQPIASPDDNTLASLPLSSELQQQPAPSSTKKTKKKSAKRSPKLAKASATSEKTRPSTNNVPSTSATKTPPTTASQPVQKTKTTNKALSAKTTRPATSATSTKRSPGSSVSTSSGFASAIEVATPDIKSSNTTASPHHTPQPVAQLGSLQVSVTGVTPIVTVPIAATTSTVKSLLRADHSPSTPSSQSRQRLEMKLSSADLRFLRHGATNFQVLTNQHPGLQGIVAIAATSLEEAFENLPTITDSSHPSATIVRRGVPPHSLAPTAEELLLTAQHHCVYIKASDRGSVVMVLPNRSSQKLAQQVEASLQELRQLEHLSQQAERLELTLYSGEIGPDRTIRYTQTSPPT